MLSKHCQVFLYKVFRKISKLGFLTMDRMDIEHIRDVFDIFWKLSLSKYCV
jgi:hypothetical protein